MKKSKEVKYMRLKNRIGSLSPKKEFIACVVVCVLPVVSLLTGCIQDEPANSEADVLACDLSADKNYLVSQADTLLQISSITSNIEVFVKPGCDLTKMSPRFIMTEGATISPENGSTHDFSDNKVVEYKVTSENGEWSRLYKVAYYVVMSLPTKLDFELFKMNDKNQYHLAYECIDGVDVMSWWNSGNPGYCLAAASSGPYDYPMCIVDDGRTGRCAKLTTCYAGSFGKNAGMPIAPGNLFLGTFDVKQALKAPLSATRFGITFTQVPDSLVGYYKFKSGKQMTDGKYKPISGVDDFNIYAMMYENTDEGGKAAVVDGTNAMDNKFLVLLAQIKTSETMETDEWTRFSIPFEQCNGKTIDAERLKKYGYNLGIVFTSSRKGDLFTGAVGSELCIDDVEIKCKELTEE